MKGDGMFDKLFSLLSGFRCKLIASTSKYPNSDLHACFANIKRRGFYPAHVVDIGANRGRWSEPCRKVFPKAGFTLLEPQVEMAKPLEAFCKRSGRAKWLQMGVSDNKGELPFVVYEDQVSSTFDFDPQKNHRNCEIRDLSVTTINDLIVNHNVPVPDIVKIDAEGFEARILRSADSIFGKTELIFLEVQLFNDDNECSMLNLARRMDEVGYAVYDFSWFGRRIQDKAIALCEVAFARKNGFLRADQSIAFAKDFSKLKKKIA
jgi:FkbM family methyltransferase